MTRQEVEVIVSLDVGFGYTKTVTLLARSQYFQASTHLPAKDLGATGCQASFPGVPCVSATQGAGRAISGTMLFKR